MSKTNPFKLNVLTASGSGGLSVTPIAPEVYADLTKQIGTEFYNSFVYLKLSLDCDLMGYTGASSYFSKRSTEERSHAHIIIDYLRDKQLNITIPTIESFTITISTLKEAFLTALQIEVFGTKGLTEIYQQMDIVTAIWFQPFIKEQIEEEASLKNIIDRIELALDNPGGLLLIDHELKGL
jgi:ferritin